MAEASRIAVVTGGNKGIGFAIVKGLAKRHPNWTVYLTARDISRGEEALKALSLPNVKFFQLDLDNSSTINVFSNHLLKTHGGLDVLINNAAIAWKGDAFNEDVARTTLNTNYFGSLHVLEQLLPLVREHGRVVNVSSQAGSLNKLSKSLQQQFTSPDLTIEKLNQLMNKFIEDVKKGTYSQEGWPKTTYGISKVGLTALTKVLARNEKRNDILINAMCPGWVNTDMSSHKGPRTPEEGAEGAIILATLPAGGPTGGFFLDGKPIEW